MWPLLILILLLLFFTILKNIKVSQDEEDLIAEMQLLFDEEDEDDLIEEFLILELTEEDDEFEEDLWAWMHDTCMRIESMEWIHFKRKYPTLYSNSIYPKY